VEVTEREVSPEGESFPLPPEAGGNGGICVESIELAQDDGDVGMERRGPNLLASLNPWQRRARSGGH